MTSWVRAPAPPQRTGTRRSDSLARREHRDMETSSEHDVREMGRLLANGVGTSYNLRAWCQKAGTPLRRRRQQSLAVAAYRSAHPYVHVSVYGSFWTRYGGKRGRWFDRPVMTA